MILIEGSVGKLDKLERGVCQDFFIMRICFFFEAFGNFLMFY